MGLLVILLLLAGCTSTGPDPCPSSVAVEAGVILDVSHDGGGNLTGLMVDRTPEDDTDDDRMFVRVPPEAALLRQQGGGCSAAADGDFVVGASVQAGHRGAVMESFPPQVFAEWVLLPS